MNTDNAIKFAISQKIIPKMKGVPDWEPGNLIIA